MSIDVLGASARSFCQPSPVPILPWLWVILTLGFIHTPHPHPCKPVERCDMSLTEETTNTKHTHKWSEAQWPSDTIHTKLVLKTLINPDCDCGYAIYLTFNDAKGSFATLRFVYCGEELFTINSKIWEVLEVFFWRCTIFMQGLLNINV